MDQPAISSSLITPKEEQYDTDQFVVAPPIVRRVEALEFTNPEIPGEIKVDKSGKLLMSWFEFESKIGSLVETYDNWVINVLPRQLASRTFRIPQGEVVVVNPIYFPPRISTSKNSFVPLTPRLARENNYTYSSEVYVDLVLNMGTPQEERLTQVFFGKIPVMLGSVLCHLRGKSDRELMEMGECPNDPFGYFIIKGSEKVVLIQEKLRMNRIFMFNSTSKGDVVCKMTSNTILGSSNVVLVKGKKSEAFKIHLAFMGRSKGASNKVGNTMTVFQIYRLLGMEKPNDIQRMISFFTKREHLKKIWVQLQPSFVKMVQIANDIEYISKKKGLGDIAYDIRKSSITNDIKHELFSHIPSENVTQKLYMLSIMVARLAEYYIGERRLDDRDNWGNKRLENAGRSLEQLFGNIWREVHTRAQDTIDTKNLQGLQSVRREIDPSFIVDNFVSSFNSNNWGVQGSYMPKENITEPLKRDAHLAVYAHLTKVNTPTSRKAKQTKVRLVQMSQLGYICPAESPEGAQCGLVKNTSLTVYISIERNENVILEHIGKCISKDPSEQLLTPVIINGKFLGWCAGETLKNHAISLRRQSVFYKDTVIVLTRDNMLYIYTDGARPTRPLLIVDPTNNELVVKNKNLWTADMKTLLDEGCVEYIDAFEQEYIQLAQTIDEVDKRKADIEEATRLHQEAIEKLAQLEMSQKETVEYSQTVEDAKQNISQAADALKALQELPPYTHSELDPTAILGISASLVPLANHNQAPRNSYACGHFKQALGIYHSQHATRFETTAKCLAFPSRPLFETQMNRVLGFNELPAGETVVVAIMTYTGFNQEDSIIMNQGSVDRGLFRQVVYKSQSSVQRRTRHTIEEFGRPQIKPSDESGRYDAIQSDGTPVIGALVKEGDCIIGKIRKNLSTGEISNASTFLGVGEEGTIEKVLVGKNPEGMVVVKVKIRQIRRPQMGDKLASRHAQKGTIGIILPEVDMPFSSKTGLKPDIIINPHAIPSRMTIAKLIEIVSSKVAAFSGQRVDATAYRKFDVKEFMASLKQYGYDSSGKEKLRSGFTGEEFEASIFMGPCYYEVLRHHVQDKIQMRAKGAVKQLSHQPVGGRARKGGLRVGEMERDALISHGAAEFLKERLCGVSDAYKTVYCYQCGTIAIAGHGDDKYICRACGDQAKFGSCTIPYSYKLLTHMLGGAGFGLKFEMKVEEK